MIREIPEERFDKEMVEIDKNMEKIRKTLDNLHREIMEIIDNYGDGEELLRLHKKIKTELSCVEMRAMTRRITREK